MKNKAECPYCRAEVDLSRGAGSDRPDTVVETGTVECRGCGQLAGYRRVVLTDVTTYPLAGGEQSESMCLCGHERSTHTGNDIPGIGACELCPCTMFIWDGKTRS